MDYEAELKSNKGPRACTTCAKAKSRCIPGPSENICERCHRLNKPCSAQTPAPPRRRKAPKTTRVAALEKRLEYLTARMESRSVPLPPTPSEGGSPPLDVQGSQQRASINQSPLAKVPNLDKRQGFKYIFDPEDLQHGAEDAPRDSARQKPSTPSQGEIVDAVQDDVASDTGAAVRGDPPRGWQQTLPPSVSSGVASGMPENGAPWYHPSAEEAQRLLDEFNSRMSPVFPFVMIPRRMTAGQLRKEKPLLWKGVMMTSLVLDGERQILLGNELLRDIVATAFLQPNKNFDLLQALEVLLAWLHINTKSFQLTNLLFLMRSICVSLGFGETHEPISQREPTPATLEEVRAFIGVYYLVTMVFTTNKKSDAFMSTTHLDECCRFLTDNMEYPTDQLAVLLVKTQQLAQSICTTLSSRSSMGSMPLAIIVRTFEHEIEQLRSSVPQHLHRRAGLTVQLHVAEILLYEVGFHEELSAGLSATERLGLLWKCLKATRSALEGRFVSPDGSWPRSIFITSFDYAYAMLVCLKLSTLSLPGWDLRLVRKELDFDHYLVTQTDELRRLSVMRHRGSQANDTGGRQQQSGNEAGSPQDPYYRLHTKLAKLREFLLAELAGSLPQEGSQTDASRSDADVSASSSAASAVTKPEAAAVDNDMAPAAPMQTMDTNGIPVPEYGNEFTDDMTQGFDDGFWQGMYTNEWETNFSAILGWGNDDATGLDYTGWMSVS